MRQVLRYIAMNSKNLLVAGKIWSQKNFSLLFVLTIAIAAFSLVIFCFGRGLDFTDDAGMILMAEQPFSVILRNSDFGFYANFLYRLAAGDIFKFRLFGMLALLIAAAYPVWQWSRFVLAKGGKKEAYTFAGLLIVLLTSILTFYCKWIPSPTYYWLFMIGELLCTGVLLQIVNLHDRHRSPWHLFIFLGFTITIAAIGRMPSASLLGFLSVLVICALYYRTPKRAVKFSLITFVFFLVGMILHIFLRAEGLYYFKIFSDFIAIISSPEYSGVKYTFADIRAHIHNFFSWLLTAIGDYYILIFFAPAALAILSHTRKLRTIYFKIPALFIIIMSPLYFCLTSPARWPVSPPEFSLFTGYAISLIPVIIFSLGMYSEISLRKRARFICYGLLFVILCICLPFGSNVPYLWHASMTLFFVFLALGTIFYLCYDATSIRIASVLLILSIGCIVIFYTTYTHRQGNLFLHTEKVEIRDGCTLKVTPKMAEYITDIRKTAYAHGWKDNTYLWELSGGRAGISYILHAKCAFFPRIVTGYGDTSKLYAQKFYDYVPQADRDAMWITTVDNGELLPVLYKNIPDFSERYEEVFSVKRPILPFETQEEIQRLWRPKALSGTKPAE